MTQPEQSLAQTHGPCGQPRLNNQPIRIRRPGLQTAGGSTPLEDKECHGRKALSVADEVIHE